MRRTKRAKAVKAALVGVCAAVAVLAAPQWLAVAAIFVLMLSVCSAK